MINKLTKKQEESIKQTRDEWINRFESLEFDEEKAKALINLVYKQLNKPKPTIFIMDSPFGVQICVNILKNIKEFKRDEWQNIEQNIWQNIGQNIWQNIGQNIWQNIWQNIRQNIGQNIWQNIGQNIGQNIWQNIGQNIGQNIEQNIEQNIRQNIEQNIRQNIEQNKLEYFPFTWYLDISDYGWIAYYDYFIKNNLIKGDFKNFEEYKELIKSNIFMNLCFDKVSIISRPPVFLKRDERGNMHCDNDYAIYFKDGYGGYYLYGIWFNKEDFEIYIKDKKAKAEDILKIQNVEQKAALIKLYGYEKLLNELPELKLIDEEEIKAIDGKLKKHRLYSFKLENREFKIMALDDHSTDKQYFLGIPLEIKTIQEALKWSFQLDDKSYYKPILQS